MNSWEIEAFRTVNLVWHALLHSSVGLDINDVSDSASLLKFVPRSFATGAPHLYWRKYVDNLIIPFFLKSRLKAYYGRISHTSNRPEQQIVGVSARGISARWRSARERSTRERSAGGIAMVTYPSTGAKTCWVTHLDGVVGCRWGCLAFVNLEFEVRISSVRFSRLGEGLINFL